MLILWSNLDNFLPHVVDKLDTKQFALQKKSTTHALVVFSLLSLLGEFFVLLGSLRIVRKVLSGGSQCYCKG